MKSKLLECFDFADIFGTEKVIGVAVSGGADSLSLTLSANEWARGCGLKIVGITVDHGLRPSSDDEARYVNELLTRYGIEHHVLKWEGEKPRTNVESVAREFRYSLIIDFCKQSGINTVLLGHHVQDQAENFLIRLFRGSGIKGLSSMQMVSERDGIRFVRPFLNIKKEDLENYLIERGISWVEDESNRDEKYLRNKIRNFLNSFDNRDDIVRRINSTISIFQLSDKIINDKVEQLENVVYFYNTEYNYYTIKLWKLLDLDSELQYRIILKISKNVSGNVLNLRFSKLERFLNSIENLKKCTLYGCVFERANVDEFVCYKEYNSIEDKTNYLKIGELNRYLKYLKNNNYQKYKKIKDFRGYRREILYTIPINDWKGEL